MGYVGFKGHCSLIEAHRSASEENLMRKNQTVSNRMTTRDDHVLKLLVPSVQRGRICVANSALLLKLHVVGVHVIQFRPKEVSKLPPIVLAVEGDCLANIVFIEIWTDNVASPKSPPHRDFFGLNLKLFDLE